MADRGALQTPFAEAVVPTHDGAPSGGAELTGGFDLPGGAEKESPNSESGLPRRIDTFDIGEGSADSQVDVPPVSSPGTFDGGKADGSRNE